MKKLMKYSLAGLMSAAAITASAFSASAADVDVYAEGAYTDTDLVVYLYADINTTDPLVSAGVSLNYDTAVLTFAGATKNETDWYFGEPGATHNYVDPDDTAGTGKVTYLLGKIRESAPSEGVSGSRVLLGTATFSHSGVTLGGATPEDYFGVTMSLGKDVATFANFVTNGASTTDPIVVENDGSVDMSSVTIRERGDADADDYITNSDFFAIKVLINNKYVVYADCDADGYVTNSDFFCVKGKINQ